MYQILISSHFRKQLKAYLKKFPDLKEAIILELEKFRKQSSVHLGKGVYKIRVSIQSLKKGKSGGFRLIVLLVEIEKVLVPLTIYFKGDLENLSKHELNKHLTEILFEIKAKNLLN